MPSQPMLIYRSLQVLSNALDLVVPDVLISGVCLLLSLSHVQYLPPASRTSPPAPPSHTSLFLWLPIPLFAEDRVVFLREV